MQRLLEIHPNVKNIGMYSTNVDNKKSQLLVVIDGTTYTLSPKLTADVREKRVKLDELGNYVVRDVVADDGKPFKSLGYAGEDISVNIAGWKASSKVAKQELTVDALMELVAI